MQSLRECFDKHGCDRGSRHSYERVYEPLFEPIRLEPLRILEIGVWRGAGIWAWLDYFPKATVFGIDTFQRVPPSQVEVLKHERVFWWAHDSTKGLVFGDQLHEANQYDIIIDDGCHRAEAQLSTWRNFYQKLKPGGMYFIEDVWQKGPGYADLIAGLPTTAKHYRLNGPDSHIIQC